MNKVVNFCDAIELAEKGRKFLGKVVLSSLIAGIILTSNVSTVSAVDYNSESIFSGSENYEAASVDDVVRRGVERKRNIDKYKEANPYFEDGKVVIDNVVNEASQRSFVSEINKNGGFIINVDSLFNLFKNDKLSKISDDDSLYNYVPEQEVLNRLNIVKKRFKGRERAVNSVLQLIDLASKCGKKMDYDWGGGHNGGPASVSNVANGVDCSGFVSWAIDVGTDKSFEALTTSELISVGDNESFEKAKSGDILVYNNGENGHTAIIIKNEIDNRRFLVAEAKCSSDGVILNEWSYDNVSYYKARDLSSVYSK